MKKYNIKIKKVFFLSLLLVVFSLPMKNVLAGEDFCTGAKGEEGICQSLWCSGTSVKDEKGSIECAEENYAQNICCIDPKTAPLENTATGVSNLSQSTGNVGNTGLATEPHQNPSLVRCNNNKGLCYDKNSGGCPSGVTAIAGDTICGKSYDCCPASTDKSCGTGNVCVDENVICINVISGANCGGGQKCCAEKIPQSTAGSTNNSSNGSASIVPSQCNSSNTECVNDYNSALKSQCMKQFTSASCSSMSNYLSALKDECNKTKPSGINCDKITENNSYGSNAVAMASRVGGASNTASEVGGLDFNIPGNLPDNPNGVKGILVNVVKWMLEIIGLITLIAFIISGGQYLMSAGDDTAMQKAKKNMTYSIIGIIVALSGFVIVRAIDAALRAQNMF